MAATLARLAAMVGPDNVGAPALADTFREDEVRLARWKGLETSPPELARSSEVGAGHHAPSEESALAIRRFRPPTPVEVIMGRRGPEALRGTVTCARVLVAAGPYRSNGEWWKSDSNTEGFSRDYWDVHASDGGVYRLHQDRRDGQWYMDGYYD
jgi:hypothetical protein